MTAPHFPKQERMVSRKLIETLFGNQSNKSMVAYPLRVVYRQLERTEGASPVQVLVSVPKKRFHHAVDRNRVKRQVREAYRHHKQALFRALPADRQLLVAFVWLSDKHCPSSMVENRTVRLLRRISESMSPGSGWRVKQS